MNKARRRHASRRRVKKNSFNKGKGARVSQTTPLHQLSSYLVHHRAIAKESILRLLKTPISSMMTWLVLAIAIAMPAAMYVGINNLSAVSKGWDGSAQISAYLKRHVSEKRAKELVVTLQRNNAILSVDYISPEEALLEFERLSGFGEALEHLDSNPLPGVVVVKPTPEFSQPENIRQLVDLVGQSVLIDQAIIDMQWVERLYSLMAVAKRLTLVMGCLLAIGVLLIIGNTIRMAIENRREEIVIIKLVGGANSFVRRPFLYTGFWYGFIGGLLALIIINLAILFIRPSASALAEAYQSEFLLQGLSLEESLLLIIVAVLLGLTGAWVSTTRHLGNIEPK